MLRTFSEIAAGRETRTRFPGPKNRLMPHHIRREMLMHSELPGSRAVLGGVPRVHGKDWPGKLKEVPGGGHTRGRARFTLPVAFVDARC